MSKAIFSKKVAGTALGLAAGLLVSQGAHAQVGDFQVGDTTFTIGGYIKADANYTDRLGADRNQAFMIPALIPLEGEQSADNATRYSVRETRINIGTSTPTRLGTFRTFVELDFLEADNLERARLVGNSTPRLRQAFGTLGPWLIGQTWGTFYNVGTKPETLDFVGPVGTLFNRNIMVRYTHDLGDGDSFMFALEQPYTTLTAETGIGETTNQDGDTVPVVGPGGAIRDARDDRYPDIVARYNVSGDWGHGSLAVMGRNVRADRSTSRETGGDFDGDDKWGYGASLTARVNTFGRDNLSFQFNAGNAIGRYIALNAFNDAYIDENGSIDMLDIYGGFVGYQLWWGERTRSNLVYSYVQADNPSDAPENVNESFQSAHVNLIHSPIERLDLGIEYIWAERKIEGSVARQDGRSGTVSSGEMNRVQVSAKYSF